jgi:hypothetical protein
MNEIIKNLFIQAGGSIEEENGNLWTYSDDLDPELFAQLVVRECANIADTAEPYKAYDLIKKHFGVKE